LKLFRLKHLLLVHMMALARHHHLVLSIISAHLIIVYRMLVLPRHQLSVILIWHCTRK